MKQKKNKKHLDQSYETHIIIYINLININKGMLVLCMQLFKSIFNDHLFSK